MKGLNRSASNKTVMHIGVSSKLGRYHRESIEKWTLIKKVIVPDKPVREEYKVEFYGIDIDRMMVSWMELRRVNRRMRRIHRGFSIHT